jgi:hypothetical protein
MPNSWNRMGREDAAKTLDRLGTQRDAVIFSRETTEVSWRPLPFYLSYRLYRLINYATMPVFTQYYLSNGTEFFPIDGSAAPIYEANSRDRVKITETTIIPYLDFFFANVQGSEGEVYLVKDPRRMPFLESLSMDQRQGVIGAFRPLKVSRDDAKNLVRVSGTICYGGSLLAATIAVASDGRLTFEDQSLLLSGIHFPPDPLNQSWLEG